MKRPGLTLPLLAVAACLSWAGSRPLAAQPAPLGPEVRVDTLTAGDQFPNDPLIAVQRDGTFEIVWDYGGMAPYAVYGRHFRADLRPTDPSQVLLGGGGVFPLVDGLSRTARGYQAVWHVEDDTGHNPRVFYRQLLDKNGRPTSPKPLKVGTNYMKWVWTTPGEGLIGAWYDSQFSRTIDFRRLAPNGRPVGLERRMNLRAVFEPTPTVQELPNGGFVGVYTDRSFEGAGEVRARIFAPDGRAIAPDFLVNSLPITFSTLSPGAVVAARKDSGFAVFWHVGDKIYVRIFDSTGHPAGPETVAVTKAGTLAPVSAAFNDQNDLLLLWFQTLQAPFRADLQIQLFGPNGAPLGGSESLPTSVSGRYQQPFVGSVAWGNSSWIVTWAAQTDDLGPSAIFVRRFARD